MQDTEKTRGGFNVTGTMLTVLVLIYFVFPVIYALPLRIVYGTDVFSAPAFCVAFRPIIYLCEHVAPYDRLIAWESEVTHLADNPPPPPPPPP